ncbi:MAG: cob(I)yrinic acid a,c-diamide adenosyltransferase [Deltaproteobacteria bacterium]|nr:cob(I)yrinic acid a,c-diamide adenosyltransferase [Deltaproteobacteria bacterium]
MQNRIRFEKGLIQVYTGNGKGKTTAALGLCFRASGHGYKSFIIQFMKGQIVYGELNSAKMTNGLITIEQMGRPDFVSKDNPEKIDVEMARDALRLAERIIKSNEYDIVVLDEVNVAADFRLIDKNEVLRILREKPVNVEVILTGRYAPQEFIDIADLVSEVREIKHYYARGIDARDGIER